MAAATELVSKLGTAFMAYTTTVYGMRNAPTHPYVFGALAGLAAYSTIEAAGGSKYSNWAALGAAIPFLTTFVNLPNLFKTTLGEVSSRRQIAPVNSMRGRYIR